ncbi:MAG: DUF167 domain-containing protein [Halioglobus sp.]
MVTLKIKVVPGASRTEISGWLGDALKVRVSAAPEKGRANAAVEALVAQTLGLPSASARIISGKSAQHKVIEIDGLTKAEILQRLDAKSVC